LFNEKSPQVINQIVNSFVGIPFVKGGRDPKIGLDCYGLCKVLCEKLGEELPDYISPDDREDTDRTVQEEKSNFTRLDAPEAFVLVLFAIRPPYESHIGIVLPDLIHFIHTSRNVGCSVERLSLPFWSKRVRGFYKWKL